MIEVVETLPLNTVQDLGRVGHRRLGVARSGVMDRVALEVGNALLGNPPGAAGIEVQLFPFRVRLLSDTAVAVTGASCAPLLDGRRLPEWWCFPAKAGQDLVLAPPRKGVRACLTVAGGIDVPVVLGSRSTHLRSGFGGLDGRMLAIGDRLPSGVDTSSGARDTAGYGAVAPDERLATPVAPGIEPDDVALRVVPAAEYGDFTPGSRELFWTCPWTVTARSNRMGYRLSGPRLERSTKAEMRSHPIVPGTIQVPPSGEPIVQLADANSAGGYPKIAVVIEADLWRIAQVSPRRTVRFVPCTVAEATKALRESDEYLSDLRRLAGLIVKNTVGPTAWS